MPVNKETAVKLVHRLWTIPDCPRNPECVDILADDLIELCLDDEEAEWLVYAAQIYWSHWRGKHGMESLLLNAKIHNHERPLRRDKGNRWHAILS